MTRTDIPALTGLRGVAAYIVLAAHVIDYSFGGRFHQEVVGLAWFGMSLFFVLSGFVIHYNYRDIAGRRGLWRFFVARFARLYPLYVLLLAVTWALFPDPPPYDRLFADPVAGLATLTLTQTWINAGAVSKTFGQSWSISTEWFFYAAFPLLVLVPVRRPRRALAIFLVAITAGLGLMFTERDAITAAIAPFVRDGLPLSAPPWLWLTYFSPYLRLLEFIAGMLACQVYLERRGPLHPACLPACLLGLLGLFVASGFVEPGDWGFDMLCSFAFAIFIAPALPAICAAPTLVSRMLASRPLKLMGEISYSVYALQFLVLALLSQRMDKGSLFLVAAVLLTTVLSVGTYWLYERPARRLIRSLFGGGQAEHLVDVLRGLAQRIGDRRQHGLIEGKEGGPRP